MPTIFWQTIIGVIGLLAVASIAGYLLKRRHGPDNDTIRNLNQRVAAWWLMVIVIAGALLLGNYATIVLFAICAFFALREFITLTPTRPADYWPLVLVYYVALPGQFLLLGLGWYGLFTVFIPVYVFFALPAAAALAQDTNGFLERNAKVQWAVMVCVFSLSHAPALLMLEIPGYFTTNAPLLLYFLLVVQSSDVFQYVCGKLWGKRKLSPHVSPSKTWEGLLGGGAMAVVLGALLHGLTPFHHWWQSTLMALVIVIGGFIGGLVLSAVKRSLGAKDWGVMLTGHGGMLDRLDSICFSAPIFFHLTRYFFTPA